MKKRVGSIFLLAVILAGGIFNIAYGLSSYKSQFNTRYGTTGSAIDQCLLCHTTNTNPSINNLNAYGTAYANSGYNFAAIESLDSDGDGFTNIAEINARTFPGDAASKPAATDTTAPTVTGFTIPATSSSLTVSITTFTATDNVAVTGYMVTESATAPLATAAGWSATAPTSYTAATAGAKTLYAWAKDAAGNVSASRSASVTVTLPPAADTTPPTVTGFTIPATSTSLTVSVTTFTATDNVGVTGYMITESATAPLATATGWSATALTSYTFATAGAKTLYAWAKDAAGNVSASRSASVTITLPPAADTTPPTVSAFTIPATSSSLTVSITTFTATDNVGVTGYMVTESATAPAASATGWTATAPTSYTFATAGAKTLYAWAKDAAGNVSASRSASVTVSAGVAIPGAPTLVSPSGTITSTTPTYTWNALSNAADYYLWVNDSAGIRIQQWYTAAQAGCSAGTGTCSATPTIAIAAGAGQWWVQARNSAGTGPWSAAMNFTVGGSTSGVPSAATLISPSGASTTNTPTYTWNAVSNSTWYYLWVSDSGGAKISTWYTAAQAGCSAGTGTCSITPATALANGAYKWWIQTWNSSAAGPWSAPTSFTVQPSGPAADMTFWVGKWFSLTEMDRGYSVRSGGLADESGTFPGYLKIWGWDQNQSVLNADRYEQDPVTGQWVSESLVLHYIGGSRLDFLIWCQIGDSGNPTAAFSARISGSEQGGTLTATFNTLGGYYQEVNQKVVPSEYRAGNLTITGSVVPAAQVPVPANILLH